MVNTPSHGRLIAQSEKERHATWLELFFDLVFVVCISGLANVLYQHQVIHLLNYTILFLMVWWLWIGISYYADQFNIHDLVGTASLFLAMVGIVLLNYYLPMALDRHWKDFAAIYFSMRLLLIVLYIRAYIDSPISRALLFKYIAGFSVAAFFWLISLFFTKDIAMGCWVVAMCIDLPTPIFAYVTTKNIPAQVSHMDERFGLFVIIVLGQTVLTVSHSLQTVSWTAYHVATALIGFLIIFFCWRFYFADSSENTIHTALRGKQSTLLLSFVYGYGHFFIYAAIVGFGVGVSVFIGNNMEMMNGLWLSLGSLGIFIGATKMVKGAAVRVSQ